MTEAGRPRERLPRLAIPLLLFVFHLTSSPLLHGQEPFPSGAAIRSIEVRGLTRVSAAYVQDVARVQPGMALDRGVLDDAVQRLLQTGRFVAASYRVESEEAGVRLIFEVRERPILTAIRFEGNRKFRDGQLLGELTIKAGDFVDMFAVRDGRNAILNKYRDAGFSDVEVRFDQTFLDEHGELVFTIDEGVRTRITKIRFEGTQTFSRRELMKQIESRTAIWIIRAGAYDEAGVESDAARLRNFFQNQGFLDAGVTHRVEPAEKPGKLTLVFSIEEGTRYRVESVALRGATVFSEEELRTLLVTRVGEFVKQAELDGDAKAVQSHYGKQGYVDAGCRVIRVFSDVPGQVNVTLDIHEGEQFRVGRVVVRGNSRTQDKVVRRALNLYPPDDLFDTSEAREAEQRLIETRLFSSARVLPVGDQPGVRDAVIDVEEAEQQGDFLFGAGVTSNSGVVGNIVLELRNFDLFDRPRSWSEFLKLKAFTGAGQRLRIELQPGTEVSRYRIDFTEPYLFDRPLRFDAGAYIFERDRDGYSEERYGASTSLGKRFERGVLRNWAGEIAVRLDDVIVGDVDLFAARDIRKDEGTNILTSVKGSLVRDRTDNRFIPSAGDRFRVSYEQFGLLGGDHHFGRAIASYTWYTTLHTDELNRKGVLALNAEGGAIVGDAPVFERFYAGGTGSIRGFRYRGIGEREGIDENNVGGDYLALLGAEYSFPLFGENVRGLLFIDSGTAGSGPWRAAVGTGVRLTINFLGPLPLEFAIAAPVASDDQDDEQIFSFNVGGFF